jgi:cytochrome b subunit of formate dehydrogenase
VWTALLLLAMPGFVAAQSNEDCLMCHSDPEAVGEKGGHEISVYVDPEAYARSVHGEFGCIDCHMDLDGVELPHDEELEPADCAACHDDVGEELRSGPHGKWAVDPTSPAGACVRCHGVHDVLSAQNPASATSPANATAHCAQCHGKESRAVERGVHGGEVGAGCADCHRGHGVKAPSDPIGQLDACGVCHREQATQHRRSLHGKAAVQGDPLAPSCVICHEHHTILSHTRQDAPTAIMNIPILCGRCHREGTAVSLQKDIPQHNILENFSMSVHGQGLFEKGLTVTAVCTSCHTSHDILDHNNPASSINRNNVASTCMSCHARIEEVHLKVIEGHLWEEEPHKVPSCVECHQPHKIRRRPATAEGAANRNCMKCHGNPELEVERDGELVSLFVDEGAYELSMHNRVACAQCHTEVNPQHPERACATITKSVDCGICHAEQVHEHELSRHGQLAERGDQDVPVCLTCHGDAHAVQGHRFPTSPTFVRNVPELCGRCHSHGEVAANRLDEELPDIVESYVRSAHGRGLLDSGLVVSASCIDCHTAHRALAADDANSSVNPENLADTCGKCHRGIEEEFRTSIHWPGNVVTNEPLPTCEDCHTSHTISRVDAQGFRFNMMDQCGRCHEDYADTFFETYHGKVTQLGSEGAAKCYDCHGTHNILPTENPESTLSYWNRVETCGSCHPKAHRQFAGYLTHATHHDKDRYPFLFYSFWFMTILLVGTLSFALLHTFAWLWRLLRTRDQWLPHKEAPKDRFYRRFTNTQRIMHVIMILSFFTLALTGMALKFSYMGWAVALSHVLGGFDTMGGLHRTAAVALIMLFGYHLRELWRGFRRSKKGVFGFVFDQNSLMFNLIDIKQIFQSIKWFFGRGPRPHYGRFTYWEKFDYFAVFWGVFVIGSTGLVLWFPEFFTLFLPGWTINVATIIHSDEALLAVAFIFTIHFFNTHFRPDKFPMDPVIFTGRVAVDELKHDKPAEYEEFIANATPEELAQRVTGAAKPKLEKAAKIFGFTALAIGLTLIALIVYSMFFAYR